MSVLGGGGGGGGGAGRLDLTQNHLKLEKKDKKMCPERDSNPRPSDYRSCT